jgi:hypothetical protein
MLFAVVAIVLFDRVLEGKLEMGTILVPEPPNAHGILSFPPLFPSFDKVTGRWQGAAKNLA